MLCLMEIFSEGIGGAGGEPDRVMLEDFLLLSHHHFSLSPFQPPG